MKMLDWIRISTHRDKIIFTIIVLFAVALFIQAAATLGLIPPSSVDDFVVDSHENILVFSTFHYRIYSFSQQGYLIDSISIPEGKAPARVAIDASDNIYVNRGGTVVEYSMKGAKQRYAVALDKTEDWLLTQDNKVVNLNKTISHEYSSCSFGNRKPVNSGQFLFYDEKCDRSLGASFEFITLTKKYILSPFWKDVVSVYDLQGRFLYKVRITPIYLKVFAFPMPFLVILPVLASLYWIINKTAAAGKVGRLG
jgi:hypothetical protein